MPTYRWPNVRRENMWSVIHAAQACYPGELGRGIRIEHDEGCPTRMSGSHFHGCTCPRVTIVMERKG